MVVERLRAWNGARVTDQAEEEAAVAVLPLREEESKSSGGTRFARVVHSTCAVADSS